MLQIDQKLRKLDKNWSKNCEKLQNFSHKFFVQRSILSFFLDDRFLDRPQSRAAWSLNTGHRWNRGAKHDFNWNLLNFSKRLVPIFTEKRAHFTTSSSRRISAELFWYFPETGDVSLGREKIRRLDCWKSWWFYACKNEHWISCMKIYFCK